jgi:DnaJ-domain-containing protein 1
MSLSTLSGDILAERSIARAADGNKYHIRCVDLSDGAIRCLFTSATRAYFLDQMLRTLRVWIMPPPAGYEVGRGGQDAANEQIERALATLELTGHPTQEEIRAQFRRLVFRYHPDRNPANAAAQERTKEIIAAYKMVSEEDVAAALEGLGDREYYYQILHETELEIGDTGYSVKLTMSMSGPGDWIYATHMTSRAERIYLGCYSGVIYCVDLDGNVLKLYQTDAPIGGIVERGRHLYIWTHTSLYVLEGDKVVNHIDLRGRELECFAEWGLILKKGSSLVLCSEDGTWIGDVRFQRDTREVVPAATGLVAYTTKERFRVLLSDATATPSARSEFAERPLTLG